MTWRSTAAGSTRPSRSPRSCSSQAQGVLVTSATLRGGDASWARAEERTGAVHLDCNVGRFEADSPFDYSACSEVLIVTDVKQGDLAGLAGAYARLIEAAGGGTLGLFTAIQRLKTVHSRIADRLARAGLPLLAQHVDPIDAGTLVDIFRDDPRASLARHGCASRRRGRARRIAAAGRHGTRSLAAPDRAACAHGEWPAAGAPMTTRSFARGWRRRSAG